MNLGWNFATRPDRGDVIRNFLKSDSRKIFGNSYDYPLWL
jgi:hypothetical protein